MYASVWEVVVAAAGDGCGGVLGIPRPEYFFAMEIWLLLRNVGQCRPPRVDLTSKW